MAITMVTIERTAWDNLRSVSRPSRNPVYSWDGPDIKCHKVSVWLTANSLERSGTCLPAPFFIYLFIFTSRARCCVMAAPEGPGNSCLAEVMRGRNRIIFWLTFSLRVCWRGKRPPTGISLFPHTGALCNAVTVVHTTWRRVCGTVNHSFHSSVLARPRECFQNKSPC